ncbi:hypothetical protein C0J52_20106 [Blattella germanica]|nr:hypothetical protein C0J52_20106 [Blattella germanica]
MSANYFLRGLLIMLLFINVNTTEQININAETSNVRYKNMTGNDGKHSLISYMYENMFGRPNLGSFIRLGPYDTYGFDNVGISYLRDLSSQLYINSNPDDDYRNNNRSNIHSDFNNITISNEKHSSGNYPGFRRNQSADNFRGNKRGLDENNYDNKHYNSNNSGIQNGNNSGSTTDDSENSEDEKDGSTDERFQNDGRKKVDVKIPYGDTRRYQSEGVDMSDKSKSTGNRTIKNSSRNIGSEHIAGGH